METTLQSGSTARLRGPFVGMLAGAIAGLLNAGVARALMRVVALVVTGRGSFSVGGTAVIFAFALIIGPLLGLAYRALRPRLPGPPLARGLLYGLGLAVFFQAPILYIVPDFRAELMIAGPAGFGVFALMNFAFTIVLAFVEARLEATWPHDDSRSGLVRAGTVVFGLLSLAGAAMLVYELGGRLVGLVD